MKQLIRLTLILWMANAIAPASAQVRDTASRKPDSTQIVRADSTKPLIAQQPAIHPYFRITDSLLRSNKYLQAKQPAQAMQESVRRTESRDAFFYILLLMLFMLGIFKLAYARYFHNLVRVFFNSSLRQSQLTDQLLQARLPSLLFNIFFACVAGYYLYQLLLYYKVLSVPDGILMIPICILAVLAIYLVKYLVLQFAGWLSGYRQQAQTYTFIVFLINKIIALALLPLVIIMSFSQPALVQVTVLVSFAVIGILLLMRFFRSYGLLHTSIKVSRFHFFLYIIGIELLPLMLIYKAAMLIIAKNA
ncbi:MAG TPA: DUF4271 domain-containing protein [Ferruginibacter sp.]|nr:DUF4271 domain-containing protein [Ferruginibacter sp.]